MLLDGSNLNTYTSQFNYIHHGQHPRNRNMKKDSRSNRGKVKANQPTVDVKSTPCFVRLSASKAPSRAVVAKKAFCPALCRQM